MCIVTTGYRSSIVTEPKKNLGIYTIISHLLKRCYKIETPLGGVLGDVANLHHAAVATQGVAVGVSGLFSC